MLNKKFKKISIKYKIFILIPALWILPFILLFYLSNYTVFPIKNKDWSLSVFNDNPNNGNSNVSMLPDSSGFKYFLKKGFSFPYSGISIDRGKGKVDLSKYDFIRFTAKATKGRRLQLIIALFMPGRSIEGKPISYRPMQVLIESSNNFSTSDIDLSLFKTSDWWLMLNHTSESDLPPPDYSMVKYIHIQSCQLLELNIEDQIEIKEINFGKHHYLLITGLFFLTVCYYTTGFLIFKKRKNTKPTIIFNYSKILVENNLNKEEEVIFFFITNHYSNPDLAITEIQEKTGISENKIATIIKNKTGLTFKQFLNKLRITESKRMLLETDLQILEIAYKVGYSNATHFNRVFKDSEGCAPNDFRKKNRKTEQ